MYLAPKSVITKKGLPGGKLENKTDKPVKIADKLIPVIEKNIPHWIEAGTVLETVETEVKTTKKASKKEEDK